MNDTFERGFDRHRDERFDRAGLKLLTQRKPCVHCLQGIARSGDGVLAAFDLDAVTARRDEHAEAVFHLDEIGIELAE